MGVLGLKFKAGFENAEFFVNFGSNCEKFSILEIKKAEFLPKFLPNFSSNCKKISPLKFVKAEFLPNFNAKCENANAFKIKNAEFLVNFYSKSKENSTKNIEFIKKFSPKAEIKTKFSSKTEKPLNFWLNLAQNSAQRIKAWRD